MKTKRYDGRDLRRVLAAMVTDAAVLGRIAGQWQPPGLFAERYANLIGSWCVKHWNLHGKPPGRAVESIYDGWAENRESDGDDSTTRMVEKVLSYVSQEHDREGELASDYLLDLASTMFDRARLREAIERAESDLDQGKVADAFNRFERTERVELGPGSIVKASVDYEPWVRAFDSERQKSLVPYPLSLGKMLSPFMLRDSLIAFMAPDKVGKCVSEDMEVVLSDGRIKTIGQIVDEGDICSVMSLDEDSLRLCPVIVSKLWDNGVKPCLELVTKSGKRMVTTSNHLYRTPVGWMPLDSIAVGDFVATARVIPVFGIDPMPEAELKFIAYMLAEGCCVGNGKGSGIMCTFTNGDPILMEDFENCCDLLSVKYKRREITDELSGNGRPLIRKWGLAGHSARTKIVPDRIFTCPRDQVATFLRVFFSCDGHISKDSSHIEITLANEMMLRQISHLLTRFGVVHKFGYHQSEYKGKKFDAWRIQIDCQEYVDLFLAEVNFLSGKRRKSKGVGLGRSYLDRLPCEIAKKLYEGLVEEFDVGEIVEREGVGKYTRDGHRFREQFGTEKAAYIRERLAKGKPIVRKSFGHVYSQSSICRKYLDSHVLWDEVVSIREVGDRRTFDLTVPGSENFVAGDCIVHNSMFLLDLAFRAARGGRRVAIFDSGDMSEEEILVRLGQRASRRPAKPQEFRWPTSLSDEGGVEWKQKRESRGLPPGEAYKAFRKVCRSRDLLRISCHPNSTLDVGGVESIVAGWERLGWVADVVVIDYADIMAPPRGVQDPLEQIDVTWKRLRRMSQQMHSLVATATQSNAAAYKEGKGMLTRRHFGGRKTKLAHVNGMIGINQTPEEKAAGVCRLNWIVLRHGRYSDRYFARVAGCWDVCCPIVRC